MHVDREKDASDSELQLPARYGQNDCVMGVGLKNYLFFGSDTGGERAAIIYSLIESCRRNQIDPQCYLQYVLERIADHPINRVEELLPWDVAGQLNQPYQVTEALAA
jgi:transposase